MDERSTRTDTDDPALRATAVASEPGTPPSEPDVDPLVGERLDRYLVEGRRGAFAIAQAAHPDPVVTADVQFALARVIDDRDRARTLATAARVAYARRLPARAVDAWLARR